MDNLMPAWAHEGGMAKLLERLADRATRKRIADECSWTASAGHRLAGGVGLTRSSSPRAGARTGGPELAQLRHRPAAPAETLMDLLLDEKCAVGMVSFSQSLENVPRCWRTRADDRLDSIPLFEGEATSRQAAPALLRHVPRVLSEYARERKLFSLETAVHKMTGMPAQRLGCRRGVVREGPWPTLPCSTRPP